jgi:hypothetical protein
MGIWARLKQGWRLGIASVRIVVSEPELLAFPVMSIVALGIVGLVAFLLTPVTGAVQDLAASGSTTGYVLLAAGAFLVAFVVTTTSTFFAAGLVYCASQVFRGEDPDVREGLRAAWEARAKIVAWGLIAATVAVVVRAIERRGQGGQIVAALFGVAWGVLTYFVVPVMVLEDVGVREMFEESARTFRETWGEYAGASVGVGLVFLLALVAAVGVLILGVLLFSFSVTLIVLLVVGFVLFVLLLMPAAQAVTGVVKTALYVYARDDEVPEQFAGEDFQHLFEERSEAKRRAGRI